MGFKDFSKFKVFACGSPFSGVCVVRPWTLTPLSHSPRSPAFPPSNSSHDATIPCYSILDMSSSLPISRQTSNDTTSSPITLRLLTLRTHTSQFSPNEVLINPALVPFAKPGALLQIIPQSALENESALASDRFIFRLGDETEKDVTTKYGNLQLSVVTEVAKAFKFITGNEVAVSLVSSFVRGLG